MLRQIHSPRGTIVPVLGERTSARLVNGVRSNYITLVFRATVTVSVAAATAIRNRGSVLSMIDEIVIDENGTDKHVYRGNVLRFLSEMSAPSALTAKRVTSTAVAAYTLEEAVRIYFSHPLSLDPTETAHVERDMRANLQVSVKAAAAPGARVLSAGGATVVVTNLTCTVKQSYEKPTASGLKAPLFIPTARQMLIAVPGASSALPADIRGNNLIRAIVVSQETATDGEVSDILKSFVFRGDYGDIVGPGSFTMDDALLDSEFEYGGAVISSNRAHFGWNFQRFGRLAECLNPAQDANLRFEFDALPSVAGAGASSIRVTVLELVRDLAVVAPEVPFAY